MMSDPLQLERLLKQLKLSCMANAWRLQEQQALAESWTPAGYLLALCSEEAAYRESERLRRYRKEAKLPAGKSLATFDFSQLPQLNAAQVKQLCETDDWLQVGSNVLLFGASGLGKSHLATAITESLIIQGHRARFYSVRELLQELSQARSQLKLNELLLKLDSYRVLVLDDLGYVKRDDGETSLLFELIAHRYERRSLIVTSNHPFSRWGEIFTDKSMAVAAADRLIHHCYLFELQGESYRKKTTNVLNNPSFN